MSFLDSIISAFKGSNKLDVVVANTDAYLNYKNKKTTYFENTDYANVSTVYTCIRILAGIVSRLPIQIMAIDSDGSPYEDKKDPLYPLLHFSPWPGIYNAQKFFSTMEYWRCLKGNSFAWIHRENGIPKWFEIIVPDRIAGYTIVNGKLYYKYNQKINETEVKEIIINGEDMLHFTFGSVDGIWGIAPMDKLKLELSINYKAKKTSDTFLGNNLFVPKVLKYQPNITPSNPFALEEGLTKFKENYDDGDWISLPYGMDVQELTMSFVDAQLMEQIKITKGDLASFFGIPPHLVALYESSKFNNVEQMMLGFKSDTISDMLRMYRQELEFKLLTNDQRINGRSIEFNTNALIETDYTTRINGVTKLVQTGMITPNQANQIEGYPIYEGGDYHWMPTNYMILEQKVNTNPTITDTSTNE